MVRHKIETIPSVSMLSIVCVCATCKAGSGKVLKELEHLMK